MLSKLKNKIQSTSIYLMAFLLLSAVACSPEKTNEESDLSLEMETQDIELSLKQFESSSMKLGKIEDEVFNQTIKSYGLIDVPPENKAAISAYFGGYVKKLSLLEGQYVNSGQVLFTLENPEYVEIQQDFLEAKGQLTYLKSDYERQKNLVQDSVTSQKIYLKAESDYQVTLVRYESLRKKLNLMNLNPDNLTENNIRSEISLTAPISGNISQIHASRGMYLNPDDIALTIINPDHIHLELSIFEKDLPQVKKGQEIRFKLQNNANEEYEAEVHLVGNYIDPERRSASIHGHLVDEEQSSLFTPGMYVEAEILCDLDTLHALPQSAVVAFDNKDFVLIFKGKQDDNLLFEKREVRIGRRNEEYVEILNVSEFSADDEFLIEGAFNLIGE
jgi:cobalt-zinc-cadmium efflux system membrane fusion protein